MLNGSTDGTPRAMHGSGEPGEARVNALANRMFNPDDLFAGRAVLLVIDGW